MMDLLIRGQYVIISAEEEEKDILPNEAVLISEGRIIEVGKYADLKEKYPIELRIFAQGMVCTHKQGFIEKYIEELFEELYSSDNDSETRRILLGPSWVQGSAKYFLMRLKEKSDQFNKVQIYLHTL
jgi:hypothetical protein